MDRGTRLKGRVLWDLSPRFRRKILELFFFFRNDCNYFKYLDKGISMYAWWLLRVSYFFVSSNFEWRDSMQFSLRV